MTRTGTTARACGNCSLCCKLLAIAELNKPIDTWCPHARPGRGGCSIYPDRPTNCRGFTCGWLSGLPEFGDEWFPARCKMILTPRDPKRTARKQGLLVTVDPTYPNAWRREPYYSQLLALAQEIPIEVRVSQRCIGLNADGTEYEVTRSKEWLAGTCTNGGPR